MFVSTFVMGSSEMVMSERSCAGCYGRCSGNIGVVFDNLFVDKDGQNLLVDVEEIFESLLRCPRNWRSFVCCWKGS